MLPSAKHFPYCSTVNQHNWTCTACGRPFGRSYSAKRHVRKVHIGEGDVVSYPAYVFGVLTGRYEPPKMKSAFDADQKDWDKAFSNELSKEIRDRFVQKSADRVIPKDTGDKQRNLEQWSQAIDLFAVMSSRLFQNINEEYAQLLKMFVILVVWAESSAPKLF